MKIIQKRLKTEGDFYKESMALLEIGMKMKIKMKIKFIKKINNLINLKISIKF